MTYDLLDPIHPVSVEEILLYDWQGEAVEKIRAELKAGKKNVVLASPTGSGKTTVAAFLIQEAIRKRSRTLFVCDRIALINQTSLLFDRYGINHGIIQADHPRHRPWEKVQVASVQTLQNRGWPHDTDLIVVDECHSLYKATSRRIAKRNCVTVGLTATPFSRGMGKLFDGVVTVRTTQQLIDDGLLSDFVCYSASEPDMRGAKVQAGEWTEQEAESRALPIVGDIVAEYLRHGEGKKFLAFGCSVAHCEELQRQMASAGVSCALYTYRTSDEERETLVKEFARHDSRIRGLVSVAALAKGFDSPSVEVIIMARPLRSSFAEHIQILGRGLRRDPRNPAKRCVVLDHAGNMKRFWSLMVDFFQNGVSELDERSTLERQKALKKPVEPSKCPICSHIHKPARHCPSCGHEYTRPSLVEHQPGKLSPYTGMIEGSAGDRVDFYAQLLWIAVERGYKPGWAAHKFKERYGEFPPRGMPPLPKKPTLKTGDWLRSSMIRWSKAQQKAKKESTF
jgi:DNA repair protein RadD